ncbi:DUF2807 domain-containing protein [Aequorivita sp. F47161]|uniref:DUF2807 domain-containing protein n=1 Tax=Aequorivita vitellina TaxID=2874475 RepID=A0A9X1QVQ5_9FLAO|nr:head GIN domain-containing protein [Aequorivita vitellina]MCG2417494.1 DUF2807 domain-containing protein [Aequorivita vitellina]MCZ4318245.1 DUF2807 domain-containing protein [Aequorivita viscosa]
MKKLLLFITLFTSLFSFSQQTRDVGDFNELKVYDLITVELIPAAKNEVVVSGTNADYVKFINDNGVLKVRMELEERFDGNETKVVVYFKNVSVLDANEGSVIFSETEINVPSLELRTQEGAIIDVKVAADNLTVKSVSGGIIEAEGAAKRQDITINSGGIYDAKDLISEDTVVSVTAGGSATIFTTEKIDAKVTAGGSIKVYGNPKSVQKKRRAGGSIEIVKSNN